MGPLASGDGVAHHGPVAHETVAGQELGSRGGGSHQGSDTDEGLRGMLGSRDIFTPVTFMFALLFLIN